MRRRLAAAVSVILGLSFAVAVPTTAMAETVEPTPDVVINELHSNDPTGARTTGSRILRPNWVTEASTLLTSRSTRGRNASESSAMRLRRNVVSDSTPPTM